MASEFAAYLHPKKENDTRRVHSLELPQIMDHSSLVSQCDSYIRQLTHMLSMLHQLCIGVSSI